jgi:hypothetical protein
MTAASKNRYVEPGKSKIVLTNHRSLFGVDCILLRLYKSIENNYIRINKIILVCGNITEATTDNSCDEVGNDSSSWFKPGQVLKRVKKLVVQMNPAE